MMQNPTRRVSRTVGRIRVARREARLSARQPPILMYHAVEEAHEDPNRLCVPPRLFDAQMSYLERRGLRGVSVAELREAARRGRARGLVGLTFDDGYENFLTEAVPVLEGHGFTATVFVVSDGLGGRNDWEHSYAPLPRMGLLDADGVRKTAGRGMEVGSHGATHARLPGIEPWRLEEEVDHSRRVLADVLGEPVAGFCYPYGAVDEAAVRAVRRAGYGYACAWKMRVSHDDLDLFRTPVDDRDGLLRLEAKLRIYPHYTGLTRSLRQEAR